MSQQNLIAAKAFLTALEKSRKLRNAWSQPNECIIARIPPDRVKEWEAACSPAAKLAKSIAEELTSLGPPVVRLVHACGDDSKLVLERIKEEIELLENGPWNRACNEMFFIHESFSPIDKVRLVVDHAMMLAEQTDRETPAVLHPSFTLSRAETDSPAPPPVSGSSEICWITLAFAANQANLSPGTMSRDATKYGIKDNGIKRKGRRLNGTSFLNWLLARKVREPTEAETDEAIEKLQASTAKARN